MGGKKKKIAIGLGILVLVMVCVSVLVWINYDRLLKQDTIHLMKKTFGVDMNQWDVDYEYENTMKWIGEHGGHILVKFTATRDEAEEVLEDVREDLGERYLSDLDGSMKDFEQMMMAKNIGLEEEELQGESRLFRFGYKHPLTRHSCKCLSTDYLHVQELADGNVTVYFYLHG